MCQIKGVSKGQGSEMIEATMVKTFLLLKHFEQKKIQNNILWFMRQVDMHNDNSQYQHLYYVLYDDNDTLTQYNSSQVFNNPEQL